MKGKAPEVDGKNLDEVSIFDYLFVLIKYSRMIVYGTIGVMILTFLILYCLPNKYTATARIMPPQQNMTLSAQLLDYFSGTTIPSSNTASSSLGGLASNLLGLKSPGDLYVGMMTGETIYNKLIEKFNLREYYKSWHNFFGGLERESVWDELDKRAKIETGKDGIIAIAVTDESPKLAADIANAFVQELDKLLQEMGVQEAKERLAFLEKERSQVGLHLAKSEEALRDFSEKNNVLLIDTQTKGMLEYIANLRATIDSREVQLQVFRKHATPFNYEIIRMETEIKGLKEKLQTAETQWEQSRLGDVCIPTSKLPSLGLEYLRLYREVKFQEGLFQLYIKLAELARMDIVRDLAVVQIVDRATPPEKKSKPKRILITVLVGAVIFFTLIFMAFGMEYWNNTQRTQHDILRLDQMSRYAQKWQADLNKLKRWLRIKS